MKALAINRSRENEKIEGQKEPAGKKLPFNLNQLMRNAEEVLSSKGRNCLDIKYNKTIRITKSDPMIKNQLN